MKILNNLHKKIISVAVLCFTVNSALITTEAAVKQQPLNYSDSLESFDNPERGFYEPVSLHLEPSGGSAAKPSANLVHLRVDIAEFSSNASITDNGVSHVGNSELITDEALQNLSDSLAYIKSKGHKAIVRVCYDPRYGNHKNYEPEQALILEHLKQLGKVYTENKDAIAYVELGMYGPWGEMHSSDCCTKENVTEALNTLLAATPDTMKIGVRTPAYIAAWLGIANSDFDITSQAFKDAAEKKGNDIYRVGMYNDGYLGSSTDLGTFNSVITRAKGIAWLNEYAKYTLYGGECVTSDYTNYINAYNTIDYISKEAFQTHTSYLNLRWNNNVIDKWKTAETYTGEGEYNGQTAFKYINDHLGYRLVMRDSVLPVAVKAGGDLDIDLNIENVGFGNIVNSKKATVVLKNSDGDVVELTPSEDINPCDFLSCEESEVKADVKLPEMKNGEWKVYFRISEYGNLKEDNNFACIRFGNDKTYWDSAIGANYIGSVIVLPESSNTTKADATAMLKYMSGITDENTFYEKYGSTIADLNEDGKVDLKDVILLLSE